MSCISDKRKRKHREVDTANYIDKQIAIKVNKSVNGFRFAEPVP